jgi:hypothetical protein
LRIFEAAMAFWKFSGSVIAGTTLGRAAVICPLANKTLMPFFVFFQINAPFPDRLSFFFKTIFSPTMAQITHKAATIVQIKSAVLDEHFWQSIKGSWE